jgi:N-dimethylarginine dimethylaminohydrolase
MAKQVLLCPPAYFDVVDRKNRHMAEGRPVDPEKALKQWQALRSALEQAGCQVEIIDPVAGMEDMVFAANQAFVGFHEGIGKFIVPSRMVHDSRQREVPFYVEWFRKRGFKIIEVDLSGEHLEGHGDLLWHPNWSRVYAGYGFRSTRAGVEKFGEAMAKLGIPVVPLQLVDPYCYHLDTCFCPLNNEALLIYPGAIAAESFAALGGFWKRIHELTVDEAHKFMGNGIVANENYLTPYITPHLEGILGKEGLTSVILDTTEFEKIRWQLVLHEGFSAVKKNTAGSIFNE